MYTVLLSPYAQKFLKQSAIDLRKRVLKRVKELAKDPFPSDCKRVVGRKEKVFRVRVGGYRILYVVFNDKKEVFISDIDKRTSVY